MAIFRAQRRAAASLRAQELHEFHHDAIGVLAAEAVLLRATHVDQHGRRIGLEAARDQNVVNPLRIAHFQAQPAEADARKIAARRSRALRSDPFDQIEPRRACVVGQREKQRLGIAVGRKVEDGRKPDLGERAGRAAGWMPG